MSTCNAYSLIIIVRLFCLRCEISVIHLAHNAEKAGFHDIVEVKGKKQNLVNHIEVSI